MTPKPTVLIVDDEPLGRDSLEALLLTQGYNLAFAADGKEALAQAKELVPDVILLDVMMPDMDGFEVCRHLRNDPVLADVPVILVTALDDRDSRLQGIEAGADDFITKPFDRTELRTRVRTITRLNRFRRLLAERTKFEWVVEKADDGYLMMDDSGKIHYANTQARLYLGLPDNDSKEITETFHQLVRKQYRTEPESAWAIWPDPTGQETPRYLVRPETPESQAFWLRVDSLQLELPSNSDRDTLWVVHLRDITAQMVLQSDKWHFHAMIAHKFRTPLIPLVTGLDLLKNYIDELSKDDITMIATRASDGITRLQGEIEDIIQYLHASSYARSAKKFSLDQMQPAVEEICSDIELKDVTVSHEDNLNSGEIVLNFSQSDTELLLREVLENSKKFHPNQSPSVTIEVIRPRFREAITLRIGDNGINLSSTQLARAWTPYYQGEKFFTGEASGMGLGLSMVASMVWNAGGICRIYNRE